MKTLKRNLPFTMAVVAALAVMAVAAVAQSGQTAPGDGVQQVTTVESEAQEAMEVLDEPRAASDAMPAEIAESIDEHAKFGMNPDLSRESIETISNSVYVIPADGYVCSSLTVGEGANLSCAETEDVAAGDVGPATVTLTAGGIAVYGIVPDGVSSVTVHTGQTDTTTIPVTENAYFTALPQGTPLRKLTYDGPSGVVEFPIYDPATAFEEQ
jgi:hypothetical protein